MTIISRVVENRELGIIYNESYDPLSEEQQRTGIKRIRRKEVIKGPHDLFEEIHKNDRIYLFLTEGLFPSFKTWNHVLLGDAGLGGHGGFDEMRRFNSEGQYLQEVLPLRCISNQFGYYSLITSPFFKIDNGEVEYALPSKDPEEIRKANLVYTMCASTSNEMWRDGKELPFFIFGNRNKIFRDYIQMIQTHPEMRQMLELSTWVLDSEVRLDEGVGESLFKCIDGQRIKIPRLVKPTERFWQERFSQRAIPYLEQVASEIPNLRSRSLGRASNIAEDAGDISRAISLLEKDVENYGNHPCEKAAILALEIGDTERSKVLYRMHLESGIKNHQEELRKYNREYDREKIDSIRKELETFDSTWKITLEEIIRLKKKMFEPSGDHPEWKLVLPKFDITYLNLLLAGVPTANNVYLPIVRHPDLRPLRWCHADAAVMERNGKTNVLFFETD